MMGKPDDTDNDQVDRYYIIQQPRYEQNENAGDQSDQWIE
jgi:hypothetical protein